MSEVRRGAPTPDDRLPATRGERAIGAAMQTLVIGAAAWVVVMSVLATVLAGFGWWVPAVVLPTALIAAVGCGWWARGIPSRALPVWTGALLAAVTLGACVWVGTTHAEQVLPRRDAGSNLQAAVSLAHTGTRVVPVDPESVGGAESLRIDGVSLASPAFYEVGTDENPSVQPQFVIGPAAIYSLGVWLGGVPLALMLPALAGGLTVLAAGLIVARSGATRWAPVAALGVAVVFPMLHTARATYSEPLAMLTLGGGLLALMAAAGQRSFGSATRAAFIAGGLIGGTALVRIDGVREAILLLPVLALAAIQSARWPRPALAGVLVSTAIGLASAWWLAPAYLDTISASLLPLAALGMVVAVVCALGVWWHRRGGRMPGRVRRVLPSVLGCAVVAVGVVLASRPLWLTVRQSAHDPGAKVIAGLQLRQGLPVDGGRTYAEQTVTWLSWWVGVPALVIALGALAWCVRCAAREWVAGRTLPTWAGPLLIAAGSTVLTLWRPGITPDHPWAERRLLIPLILVVALCVSAAAYAVRHLSRRAPVALPAVVGVGIVAALLAPTVAATWPHRASRIEAGELAAVERVCQALRPGDVVLAIDSRSANEWPQVIRGQCGIPALALTQHSEARLTGIVVRARQIDESVRRRGGRLVLLASEQPEGIEPVVRRSTQVVDTTVVEDQRLVERRPDGTQPLPLRVWFGELVPLG